MSIAFIVYQKPIKKAFFFLTIFILLSYKFPKLFIMFSFYKMNYLVIDNVFY